jgi:hypothetical protein
MTTITPAAMFAAAQQELDQAYRALGDAADWLRSDWPPGTVLTDDQADQRDRMFEQIGAAKTAINRARADTW